MFRLAGLIPQEGVLSLYWQKLNREEQLKLYPNKTEVVLVGRRSDPGNRLFPVLDAVVIPLKEQVPSLRVLLDLGFLLDAQVVMAAGVPFISFGW